jgi:hypothetical protein
MRIHEYYRFAANLSLNGSIASLIPAIFIITCNLSFFQNREIMLLTIPFLVYSLFSFQSYLFKLNRSIYIGKNMLTVKRSHQSIFEGNYFLVLMLQTRSPVLKLFFPNGYQAGELRKLPRKGFISLTRWYALSDTQHQIIGYFKVKRKTTMKIDVYNQNKELLGCYKKEKIGWRKYQKEILDASGTLIETIQGSTAFMDEQIKNHRNQETARLRRGWMPLEWDRYFPETNTPVLSFRGDLSNNDKLLRMSLLINEYFIER